jgi:hypothetical protein
MKEQSYTGLTLRTEFCGRTGPPPNPLFYINIDTWCRVSPYSLSWADAEAQCQLEGGHLASIPSLAVSTNLIDETTVLGH